MTIAEVSRRYQLSPDTLRYYERIGLIPAVGRTKSGIRDYSESDCNWVEFIKCMRGAGLPIESLVEYVALFVQGDKTIPARKLLLIEQRQKLAQRISEMQGVLARLDTKIEGYDSHLLQAERALVNQDN
ncbi:MerR family transcriptional regulator [Neobittarella massiliensis]|uniref:MerR family transcriptional regulator n=2 Tax=Oscillospiraceae TaxID=216572 RepID=A0A8J6LTF0_9FIRM|nr:MerR family transcriptional regulator [Neobittarella massiliensis]MBC3515269.1 MerR family transcriptional regulator [Neobittarella massiliensis]SCJ61173.1 HTH-type transcriptional regulator AdhR [uncultured Anaerotruncus sp.]